MRKKTGFILVMTGLLAVFTLTGCRNATVSRPSSSTEMTEKQEALTTKDPTTMNSVELDGLTEDVLKRMTLKEKVGQMFLVNVDLLDDSLERYPKEVSKKLKKKLKQYPVGGVVLFSRDMKNRKQIKTWIRNLQETARISMFVAVDEEGGSGSRLKELGFNVNFAPVAEVSQGLNRELDERTFGEDTEQVSEMVSAYVQALQKEQVSATLKYFPGQATTKQDTHKGSAVSEYTIKQLRKSTFLPFEAGIKAGTDFVMVSHVEMSNVLEEVEPASLSPLIMTEILRNELGYENIIITDAFNMKAITNLYKSKKAAVKAIEAGADIVLMPTSIKNAYEGVLDAVQDGKLSEERIDESVRRIIRTKLRRGIITLDSYLLK
ncbi:MAG: glycoside hydrolase family 3 protein [Lachnospiraceae bacterium]